MTLLMVSDAFDDGGIVPQKYGCFGDNVQPGFTLSNAPQHSASYALESVLDLPPSASRRELMRAMDGKTAGKAAYVGRFRRAR